MTSYEEYPPRADLVNDVYHPLPVIPPGTVNTPLNSDEATEQAGIVLDEVNAALAAGDAARLKGCFRDDQAFWRDMVALTCHLRTFSTSTVVSNALLETTKLRGLTEGLQLQGPATFVPVTPVLVSYSTFFISPESLSD